MRKREDHLPKAQKAPDEPRVAAHDRRFDDLDPLALQRSAGNAAVARLLGRPTTADSRALQRMTAIRTRADLGYGNAQQTWQQELFGQVGTVLHHREGIPNTVKAQVNAFGDGQNAGTYKHHVPYDAIAKAIIDNISAMTLGQAIGYLDGLHQAFGVRANEQFDPQRSRADYDGWLDSAIVALADNPSNIFRWANSTGGWLDTPIGAGAALMNRLNTVRQLYLAQLNV